MKSNEKDPAWHGVNPLVDDPAFRDDPYPALHRLRAVAPVNETPGGFWRLSRHADCVRLLRQVSCGVRTSVGHMPDAAPDEDPSGPRGQWLLYQDPPAHTRLRNVVARLFSPLAAQHWRPRVQRIVDELLDQAQDIGEMEVIQHLALPVRSALVCEMMGIPTEDRDRFTAWTVEAIGVFAGDSLDVERQDRTEAAAAKLCDYFENLFEARRQSPGDDLLSLLIRAEEAGSRVSPWDLQAQSIGHLLSGFETVGFIANCVKTLIQHPGESEKLRQKPELIGNAVEECLRFEGPIGSTIRVLHADAEFGGKVIQKDSRVCALFWAANRDPERFAEPDRFDVERPDNDHLAFGAGNHLCFGAHLARVETQVALGTLVRRFRDLELTEEKIEWSRLPLRVPRRLPIRFNPT